MIEQNIQDDWDRAITADPRIAELAEAAYDLVRFGDRDTHHADAVYGDLKPYLSRLVGWERGDPPPVGRRSMVPELPGKLLPIVSKPYVGRAEDEQFLRGDRAYDVCHDIVFTNLCRIYDQR